MGYKLQDLTDVQVMARLQEESRWKQFIVFLSPHHLLQDDFFLETIIQNIIFPLTEFSLILIGQENKQIVS